MTTVDWVISALLVIGFGGLVWSLLRTRRKHRHKWRHGANVPFDANQFQTCERCGKVRRYPSSR